MKKEPSPNTTPADDENVATQKRRVLEPTPAEAMEQGEIIKLFSALLHWDLRLTFHASPAGTVYTVSDEDGTEILVRVTRADLESWVKQRQTREIYDQLPAKGVILLTGAPMAGKTETALHMTAIAEENGPVIYAAIEDGEPVIRERIGELGLDLAAVIAPKLPRLGAAAPDSDLVDILQHHLAEMRPALVVIDSLTYIAPESSVLGAEERNVEALKQLESFALGQDARILVVHHARKPEEMDQLSTYASATLHQHRDEQGGRQLALHLDDQAFGFRLISETGEGWVDLGVQPSVDGSGTKVFTITDTATSETLVSNATLDEVRLWASPDPVRLVLGRIANMSRTLTAMLMDGEVLKQQLDEITNNVLELAKKKNAEPEPEPTARS